MILSSQNSCWNDFRVGVSDCWNYFRVWEVYVGKMISRGGYQTTPKSVKKWYQGGWGDMKHIRSPAFNLDIMATLNRQGIEQPSFSPLRIHCEDVECCFFFTIHISKFRVNQTMAMIQCALRGHKLWSIWSRHVLIPWNMNSKNALLADVFDQPHHRRTTVGLISGDIMTSMMLAVARYVGRRSSVSIPKKHQKTVAKVR